MKKRSLSFFVVLFAVNAAIAQDQLFKKDNTKVLVKIIEINPEAIKYKLFSNLTGPTYSEDKNNVSLVIYENGRHEVISDGQPAPAQAPLPVYNEYRPSSAFLSKADSLSYYRYNNNISINFLTFFNNEIGITYQKEFFKSNFNIIIPLEFGIAKPNITQGVYFNNNNRSYNNNNGYSSLTLDQKIFDVGFGINYYPSLRRNINYFVGPVFKYMQYNATQVYNYTPSGSTSYSSMFNHTTMSRYTMSITNGLIIRTHSRLTASVYGSLGFKSDAVSEEISDPVTGEKTTAIHEPVSLFFWGGFNIGFSF